MQTDPHTGAASMKKHWTIFILGVVVVLTPFLGFPGSVETFITVVAGLAVAVLMFLVMVRERYARHAAAFRNRFKQRVPLSSVSERETTPPQI